MSKPEESDRSKETVKAPEKSSESASQESIKHAGSMIDTKHNEMAHQKDTENRPPNPTSKLLGRPEIVGDDGKALVKGRSATSDIHAPHRAWRPPDGRYGTEETPELLADIKREQEEHRRQLEQPLSAEEARAVQRALNHEPQHPVYERAGSPADATAGYRPQSKPEDVDIKKPVDSPQFRSADTVQTYGPESIAHRDQSKQVSKDEINKMAAGRETSSDHTLTAKPPISPDLHSVDSTPVTAGTAKLDSGPSAGPQAEAKKESQDFLPPVTHPDGSVVERHYSTEDLKQASSGTIEQAGLAVKNLQHADGSPATDQEKAQYAVDIIHERTYTTNEWKTKLGMAAGWVATAGGHIDPLGIDEARKGNLALDALRAYEEKGTAVPEELRKYVKPDGSVDHERAAWELHAARCGEHSLMLANILKAGGVKDVQVFRTQDTDGKGGGHDFVVVGRGKGDPNDPSKWGAGAFIADSWDGRGTLPASNPEQVRHEYFKDGVRKAKQVVLPDGSLQNIEQQKK